MAKKSLDVKQQDLLMAQVPPGAYYIVVKTELGKIKYKTPKNIATTDEIQIDGKGKPVVIMKKPGRPKRFDGGPANDNLGELLKRKEQAVATDPILKVAKENPESPDVLHEVMLALSTEAANLEFERKQAENQGEDTGGVSTRRINALKAVGDTWLKRKEQIASRGVDMDSPAFKTLFTYIAETFRDALASCEVRPELIETVFARFAKTVGDENWEAEARNRMKHIV